MEYPKFLDPIESASRADLQRLQEGALQAMCAHAYAHAPLIRKTWDNAGVSPTRDIKSTADFLAKAPIINKDDIRRFRDDNNDPSGGMGKAIAGVTMAFSTTSGTTGDPTPIPNWHLPPSEEMYFRDHWYIGLRPGDYFTYSMFTFRNGHRHRVNSMYNVAELCFGVTPDEVPRIVEASKRWRPTSWFCIGTPLLLALEQYFDKTGADPIEVFKSYKGAIFGGEPLGARLRKLTRSWGLELFETTSLGEITGATMCRMHDGFHAYEDVAFIETVDPVTREPIADGAIGELVVTTLVDRLTPLIRYASGDLVQIDRGLCGCGRAHARFKVLGRASDQIIVKGRSILPRELTAILELESETRAALFQIVRTAREMDKLHLRVGYDKERLKTSVQQLHDRVRGVLEASYSLPLQIELVDEQELLKLGPPHKIPRVTKQ